MQDRDKWHEVVKRGAKSCEARRNTATEQCRKLKALPHQHPPSLVLVLTIPDSTVDRFTSLAICILKDTVNHGLIR